jgi:hypothetical protein
MPSIFEQKAQDLRRKDRKEDYWRIEHDHSSAHSDGGNRFRLSLLRSLESRKRSGR